MTNDPESSKKDSLRTSPFGNSITNDTIELNSPSRSNAAFVEPPRRRLLGIVLLATYLSLFAIVSVGFYRIMYVMALVSESQPIDETKQRIEVFIESTRHALWYGPMEQRIDILRQIGTRNLPAGPFIDDLRKLIRDENQEIASEAVSAINRIMNPK